MPKTKRTEKKSKISFESYFCSDIVLPDLLYAKIVRSSIAKGNIISICADDLPEGYFLFTAKDVPGNNLVHTAQGKLSLFSDGKVSYLGEPLGILVGKDEKKLNELLQTIQIDYNTTDTNVEEQNKIIAERHFERGSCFVPDENGNVLGIESVFKNAHTVAQKDWVYSFNVPYYRETNGAVCFYDNEKLTIYTPTQWLSNLRKTVSDALKIDKEDIVVNKTTAYDHRTNSIWYNAIIASQVAVASYCTKKPVKLIYTREEQQEFIDKLLPIKIKHKTALSEQGKLLAMQVDIELDAGSSNIFVQEIIDRLAIASCGYYVVENISVTSKAFSSCTAPSSVDFRLIDSASLFAVENQINYISSKCSFTPLEIRKINTPSIKDEKSNANFLLNINKISETLNAIEKQSDFNRKHTSYHIDTITRTRTENKKENETENNNSFSNEYSYITPVRGIGLACGFEGSCYYGSQMYSSNQELAVTLESNGNVIIHSPPVSPSVKKIWNEIVISILEVSKSSILIDSTFNHETEPLLPEIVHSNISIMTLLLKKCCESIKKRKEGTKLPYTVKKKISSSQKKVWDAQNFTGLPFHNTSFIAATVELEFDISSFRENIRGINIIVNAGKILTPISAANSIKRAVQKTLYSLVKNDNIECENVNISFIQSDDNPTQVGELVYQVLPAAYTKALSQALGKTVNKIPLQTESLYNLFSLQKNKQKYLMPQATEEEQLDNTSNS